MCSGDCVLYGCTSSSCKCQRGFSQTGRAACRKELVPLGPHNPFDHFGLQVSVTGDFTKWSFWQREASSSWRRPWVLDSASLAQRSGIPVIEQLLACHWAPVKRNVTHGGLMSLQSDSPSLRWVSSYSVTNNVESQLKLHIWEYIWPCLSPKQHLNYTWNSGSKPSGGNLSPTLPLKQSY